MKKYILHFLLCMIVSIILGIILKRDMFALVLASSALYVACGADKDD